MVCASDLEGTRLLKVFQFEEDLLASEFRDGVRIEGWGPKDYLLNPLLCPFNLFPELHANELLSSTE
jgi:hypothetical protein